LFDQMGKLHPRWISYEAYHQLTRNEFDLKFES